MLTAVTILTIQQLSETKRYQQQFALFYTLPAVPAILIAGSFIVHMALLPEPGVMVGLRSPAAVVTISLGVFLLIYAVYILVAYTGLKRNVLPK